jgi:hypothetical protein
VTSTTTAVFVATAGLVGVTVDDAVTMFEYDAKTDDPPIRAIVGPTTGLHDPHGIWVHAGELYVANQSESAVRIFAVADEDANDTDIADDVAPLRVIKGAATGLSFPAGVLVATSGG